MSKPASPHSHNSYYSILLKCSISLIIVANLLLCLIYKLNFIIGMYIQVGEKSRFIVVST